jgi:hypothetical protein
MKGTAARDFGFGFLYIKLLFLVPWTHQAKFRFLFCIRGVIPIWTWISCLSNSANAVSAGFLTAMIGKHRFLWNKWDGLLSSLKWPILKMQSASALSQNPASRSHWTHLRIRRKNWKRLRFDQGFRFSLKNETKNSSYWPFQNSHKSLKLSVL